MLRFQKFLRAYKVEIVIFAIALLLRFFYFELTLHINKGDLVTTIQGADFYFVISQNIVAGHGYSSDTAPPYTLNSVRPPVTPYFLAAIDMVFHSYIPALIAYLLIGSSLPLIAMRLSRYIVNSRVVSIVVGSLLAIDPYTILFSTIFYSETLFMLSFFISLLCLFRYLEQQTWRDLALSAVFLGIATLTKPTVQYLPVVFGLFLLWESRKHFSTALWRSGMFVLIFLACISPWVYRNYVSFGSAGISSQVGVNLYSVLVPSVLSISNGTTWGEEFERSIHSDGSDPNRSSIADSQTYTAKAIPILFAHPMALAIVCANNMLNFYIHDGTHDVLKHINIRTDVPLGKPALFLLLTNPAGFARIFVHYMATAHAITFFARIIWILITGFFCIGIWRFWHKDRNLAGIAALLVIAYFMLTTLVVGIAINSRYRLPVNMLILTFAAYGAAVVPWVRRQYQLIDHPHAE